MTSITAKGEATRRRLLDAASAEFARYGIAGARVDRIADASRTNKAQLYAFFGSKDGLFDAVYAELVATLVSSVPLDGADLPGYAVRLYDSYLARPEVVRLTTWARLERHPVGDLYGDGVDHDAAKVAAVRLTQDSADVVDDLDPRDILGLVTAMSMTWSPASPQTAADPADPEELHVRRRAALRRSVARAFVEVRATR